MRIFAGAYCHFVICHCHDSGQPANKEAYCAENEPYGIPIFGYLRFSSYLCNVEMREKPFHSQRNAVSR